MIKWIKVYKLELLIVGILAVLYFVLRLPNLTLQPIFADEAIYIRWAQIMKAEPTLRFLPLSDGKTPLFMWILMPMFKVFTDPLFAGRFLSVISGFVTFLGVLFLGWRVFNLKAGIWGAFLVVITPFMVFFDRMALVDSMLSAFSIWSLNLSLLLIKYPRLDLAMFLGYFLGGGLLTKPPGFFSILSLPATLVIFNWKTSQRQQKILKIFGLWLVAFVITFAIYSVLKLGPGFSSLSSRNQDYMFSPLELIGRITDPFIPHFYDLVDWLPKLLTVPVLILSLVGVLLSLIKRNKYALAILLWSFIPLIAEMALLRTFTARYILFSIPPLLVLSGWMIQYLSEKIKFNQIFFCIILLLILLPQALFFNFRILTNPADASLPKGERRGYLEDWTAGYGLKQIAEYLMVEAQKGGVVVGTEGSFGTLPDGLNIYLDKYSHTAPKDKQIIVIGGKATVSAQLKEAALEHSTFFIANKSRFPQITEKLELIKEYPKAVGLNTSQDAILLFKVLGK